MGTTLGMSLAHEINVFNLVSKLKIFSYFGNSHYKLPREVRELRHS